MKLWIWLCGLIIGTIAIIGTTAYLITVSGNMLWLLIEVPLIPTLILAFWHIGTKYIEGDKGNETDDVGISALGGKG